MYTADEVFFKEFTQMMSMRKAKTEANLINKGIYDETTILGRIQLPPEFKNYSVENYDKIYVSDIDDTYYSALNDSENLWWTKGQLTRRKYDYQGKFIKDKNGNVVKEYIDIPIDCVAIISDVNVHVPAAYTNPDDTFIYVDMLTREFDGQTQRKYIYIIPRKYCHKMYQTALVLSIKKPKHFYSAYALAFTDGFTYYLSVLPYKATKKVIGRCLRTKTSDNYFEELSSLRKFWVENRMLFNPNECILSEVVKGRDNMAIFELPANEEFLDKYDTEHTLERNTENLITESFSMAETDNLNDEDN